MNLSVYDKLPAEAKAAFERENEKYPNSLYRAEIRGVDAALTNATKAAGGTVVDTTTEQRAEWQKALGNFWITMAKDIGPDGEKFFAVLENGKKACENAK
jgi:TRAP-type C4-dicarboxylate transport system substrate-binding protein